MFYKCFTLNRFVFPLDVIYCCEIMKYIPLGIRQNMRCISTISVLSAVPHIYGI